MSLNKYVTPVRTKLNPITTQALQHNLWELFWCWKGELLQTPAVDELATLLSLVTLSCCITATFEQVYQSSWGVRQYMTPSNVHFAPVRHLSNDNHLDGHMKQPRFRIFRQTPFSSTKFGNGALCLSYCKGDKSSCSHAVKCWALLSSCIRVGLPSSLQFLS